MFALADVRGGESHVDDDDDDSEEEEDDDDSDGRECGNGGRDDIWKSVGGLLLDTLILVSAETAQAIIFFLPMFRL